MGVGCRRSRGRSVGHQAQVLSVRAIGAAEAARRLAGCERREPSGLFGPGDLAATCERGQCFEIEGAAQAVYVVKVHNGVVWIDALKGTSGQVDVIAALDAVVTAQAAGARSIACQTKRRALVAALTKRGFRITGWILKRDMQ